MALFPQYRAALQLAGADRVHPADLWKLDWQWFEVPADPSFIVPFGQAAVRREGTDVTIVGISRMAVTAMKAADQLAERGISAEVIDPRTLRPLDLDTILRSVEKTNRVVIVQEAVRRGGVASDIASIIQEEAFYSLDAPIEIVAGADVPMPYSRPLEQAAYPHAENIVASAMATFQTGDRG